jgi:general secretion pathway protein G
MPIVHFFRNRPTLLDHRTGRPRYKIIFLILLAVIAIAFGLPRLVAAIYQPPSIETGVAQRDMTHIVEGLRLYRQDNGMYPSAEQGLLALILKPTRGPAANGWKTGGYIDRLPRDPWGHPYQYRIDEADQTYRVFSYGPSGPNADEESDSIILAR